MKIRAIGYRLKVDPILTDNLSRASNRDFFTPFFVPLAVSVSELQREDESVALLTRLEFDEVWLSLANLLCLRDFLFSFENKFIMILCDII